jgi:hypothetical protein
VTTLYVPHPLGHEGVGQLEGDAVLSAPDVDLLVVQGIDPQGHAAAVHQADLLLGDLLPLTAELVVHPGRDHHHAFGQGGDLGVVAVEGLDGDGVGRRFAYSGRRCR